MRIVVLPPKGIVYSSASPWMELISGLNQSGHEVGGFGGIIQGAEGLVSLNHQSVVARIQAKKHISPKRTALIAFEPRVTAPGMYRQAALKLYGHRFAASPIWAEQIQGESFPWPQDLSEYQARETESHYAATLINASKRSAVTGSLYGLRRSTIASFDDHAIPLAVFGSGWDDRLEMRVQHASKAMIKAAFAHTPIDVREALSHLNLRPNHWLGTVQSKSDAFKFARSSIIIENSNDYVSEKLIDAVRAGVVPLYVGPGLRAFNLPENIAISCPPDVDRILSALRNLSPARMTETVLAGSEWLHSPSAWMHEIRSVLYQLGLTIGARLV